VILPIISPLAAQSKQECIWNILDFTDISTLMMMTKTALEMSVFIAT
jgi:hypothetical protein